MMDKENDMRIMFPALLLVLLALAGCGDSTTDGADAGLDAGPIVEACDDGVGCPCTLDDTLPAAQRRLCDEGLVCDAVSSHCRMPLGCEQLGCVSRQLCERPEDGDDFVCLEACEPGFDWDAQREGCVAVPATCDEEGGDGMAAIGPDCAALSRACIDDALGARCGLCLDGHVAEGGACRPVVTCDDGTLSARCTGQGRACEQAGPNADARCGACPEGTLSDAGDNCVMQTCEVGVAGSIAGSCAAALRLCQSDADGAQCGACYANHVQTAAGDCRPARTRADLGCHLQGRSCVDAMSGADAVCGDCLAGYLEDGFSCVADPAADCSTLSEACADEHRTCAAGACDACLAGFVENPATGRCEAEVTCADCEAEGRRCEQAGGRTSCGDCADLFRLSPETGACVPTVRCHDAVDCPSGDGCLQCDSGQVCVPAVGQQDASCRPDCSPLPGSNRARVWNGYDCAPCPPCDGPGEDGAFPLANVAGECICRTQPGFYYTRAADVGAYPCDADGDGWVREGARAAIESADVAIADNARCDLREATEIVLENERGAAEVIQLDEPLKLYETDRNDDAALLKRYRQLGGFDAGFGSDAEAPTALLPGPEHLDRFTKYCHLPGVDYNDNGVPDVAEWGGQAPLAGATPQQGIFNRFSHFGELHTTRFEPTGDTAYGQRGRYVISERPRTDAGFPLRYAAGDDAHWQQCLLRPDARVEDYAAPVGMDFATEPGAGLGEGMLLHSQFKCLSVRTEPRIDRPQEVTDDPASRYQFNDCVVSGVDGEAPEFSCAPTNAVGSGQVRWAGVRFSPYALDAASYEFGCVDECDEDRAGLLVERACPRGTGGLLSCEGDALAFGRNTCGEICEDGADNDGDGQVDETSVPLESECASGLPGQCGVPENGRVRCIGGSTECVSVYEPLAYDLCDARDGDCDGQVDEDEDPSAPHPGVPRSGDACIDGLRSGICRDGTYACKQITAFPSDTVTTLACEANILPGQVAETCNGLDDDCDGSEDDGLGPATTCGAPSDCAVEGGVGACSTGMTSCVGGETTCVAFRTPGQDSEICNGIDDDCDGQVDEDQCWSTFNEPFTLRPIRVTGDREFDGNGPRVQVDVQVTPAMGTGFSLDLDVEMTETGSGTTGGNDSQNWQVPTTRAVSEFRSSQARIVYTDDDTDLDVIIPLKLFPLPVAPTNESPTFDPNPMRLITGLICVGDTGGNDLKDVPSDSDADHSSCTIEVTVEYREAPPVGGTCGNGTTEGAEACDDGNRCDGDGCSATCRTE